MCEQDLILSPSDSSPPNLPPAVLGFGSTVVSVAAAERWWLPLLPGCPAQTSDSPTVGHYPTSLARAVPACGRGPGAPLCRPG